MVKLVYEGLRRDGHVRLVETGLALQPIDRPLAMGLGLPRDWGVVVADVALDGAGHAAGVQPGDVIASIDGHPIPDLAAVTTARYLHPPGKPVRLVLLRGDRQLSVNLDAKERSRPGDLTELATRERSLVRPLGVIGVDVGPELKGKIPDLLVGKGVVVAARTLDTTAIESGLRPGDVIHSVNRSEVTSVEELRRILQTLKRGDPVAIQIERDGKLAYLSFEME
jgi:serine protease Do